MAIVGFILDAIPDWFPTASGAFPQDLARGHSARANGLMSLYLVGLGLVFFVIAALRPAATERLVSRRVHALTFGVAGVLALILAVLFVTGLVHR